MGNFFADIYLYFKKHRPVLFAIMFACFAIMAVIASRVKLNEDILSFIPNSHNNKNIHLVFNNLKSADKILIMFSNGPGVNNPDSLIEVADNFCSELYEAAGELLVAEGADNAGDEFAATVGFVYDNLPVFLEDQDYSNLEKILSPHAVEGKMEENYSTLTSMQGFAMRNILMQDPLGIANGVFEKVQSLGKDISYNIYNGAIFSSDMGTLLVTITPKYKMGETGANKPLVELLEKLTKKYGAQYFGGPSVAVHNAESIKGDTYLTMTIAMIILALIITIAFKNKFAIILIGIPVLFGGLFALSIITLVKGSISAIAIGTGTAVFGIAMSYAIHMIAHQNHTDSIEQIIKELAYPLTIGSFTTIGAFLGLLLTESSLLRDFGLFASLSLIGTTIFCLIFLPHFLSSSNKKSSLLLKAIDSATGYNYHKNKWIISLLAIITVASLFWYNKVEFNSNMHDLSITPAHLKAAEENLGEIFQTKENILFISSHEDPDSAAIANIHAAEKLDRLHEQGLIKGYTSIREFIIPEEVQLSKIEKWNRFWEEHNRNDVRELIESAGIKAGFKSGTFRKFFALLEKEYEPLELSSPQLLESPLLKESYSLISENGANTTLVVTRVEIPQENKEAVYQEFEDSNNIVVADKSFYANAMAESINNDFNTALLVSSLLIFIALLISYGRIELALLAFLPMAVAWIIILAIMAIFKIEFNIINIILSTFIFGIGDDFSIFIMDGLLKEYKSGEKILPAHKTAIFFSAFSTIIGIGALIFASHPALKSIALVSIIGMATVVLVSFTVQPVIFNLFIKRPAEKGGFPYTFLGVLNTIYAFLYFLVDCIILQLVILVLLIVPYNKEKKKEFFHKLVSSFCRVFLKTMFTVKFKVINRYDEDFTKPAVIIANHQSFVDILVMLALCPKCIMITNGWVWRSPFFGWIIRYADFYHTEYGYEHLAEHIRPTIEKGYSVVIFPEGTRSADNMVHKFRKGAFYLAELMKLDILPVVLYGNGHISSKKQPFYIKKGVIAANILQRIHPENIQYKQVAKECNRLFVREYDNLYSHFAVPQNSYFYNSLIKNYIYKGPVLEWYMRIKVKMERNYMVFHNMIPQECTIVDIGCGYGPASFMLSLLSPKREITGIDYDKEKIDTANNSLLMRDSAGEIKGNIRFIHADIMEYELPQADIFMLNDMLHYLSPENQRTLIENCIAKLNCGGKIIIRDGDTNKKERHKMTALSEKFSTEIIRFNKNESGLHFLSSDIIVQIASRYGLEIESIENDSVTSNTIYLLSNPRTSQVCGS